MKKSSSIDLVSTLKASGLEGFMQVVHRMVQKSCRTACQLLCCPIDRMLCHRPSYTCCPAQCHQSIDGKKAHAHTQTAAIRHPPSTILIVNISNSTLTDCIIGNNHYPSVAAESQRLMQEPELPTQEQVGCSCSHGQQGEPRSFCSPPPSPSAESAGIHIHSSHLNCVVIGDNNYMHVEQTLAEQAEAQSEAWASES